jgi:hypothetical protein
VTVKDMKKHIKFIIIIVLIVSFFFFVLPVSASDGSVTQSGHFTFTITGIPNTAYYVWLTGTFTMTGAPGDQPPIILANQENVVQDPPGGPYTIGSYKFSNGNGRTILQDVAPSTPQVPSTSYYALATTDSTGQATVEFQTSPNTATRSFTIRKDTPNQAINQNTVIGLGGVTNNLPPIPTIVPTIQEPTTIPTTPILTPSPTPLPTTVPLPSPAKTPTRPVAFDIGFCILAVGMGLLVIRKV